MGEVVKFRERGSDRINRASNERNDIIKTVPGQQVHQSAGEIADFRFSGFLLFCTIYITLQQIH